MNVTSSNGTVSSCYQNVHGIGPLQDHGVSFPSTVLNAEGYTAANDGCVSVMTMSIGSSYHDWIQNGNGRDCPGSNTDWPNANYGTNCFLAVWIS